MTIPSKVFFFPQYIYIIIIIHTYFPLVYDILASLFLSFELEGQ